METKYTLDQLLDGLCLGVPDTLMQTVAAIMDGTSANAVSSEDVGWETYIEEEHEMRVVSEDNGYWSLMHGVYAVNDLDTGDELFVKPMMVLRYNDHAIVYPEVYIMDWGQQ